MRWKAAGKKIISNNKIRPVISKEEDNNKILTHSIIHQPNQKIQLQPDIELRNNSKNFDTILNADVDMNKESFVTAEETHESDFTHTSVSNYDDLDLQITSIIEKIDKYWICKVCGKNERKKSVMILHAERHVKGRSFTCDKCPKVSKSRLLLKRHKCGRVNETEERQEQNLVLQLTALPNEDSTNNIKDEVFDIMEVKSSNEEVISINKVNEVIMEDNNKISINEELISNNKINPVLTEYEDNNKIFTHSIIPNINKDELGVEIMTMIEKVSEGKDSRWKCNICEKESGNKGHLREHVEKHIEGLEYSCSGCNMVSKSSSSMRSHILKHKENFIC